MFKVYYFATASGRKPVVEFIEEQPSAAQKKIFEAIRLLEKYGFHLETRYLRRMSGTKRLWELRETYQSVKHRIFLIRTTDTEIVLLHAIIKKTPKTPRKDIKTAEKRMRLLGIH